MLGLGILIAFLGIGLGLGLGIALAPWIIRRIIRSLLWDEVDRYQYHRMGG